MFQYCWDLGIYALARHVGISEFSTHIFYLVLLLTGQLWSPRTGADGTAISFLQWPRKWGLGANPFPRSQSVASARTFGLCAVYLWSGDAPPKQPYMEKYLPLIYLSFGCLKSYETSVVKTPRWVSSLANGSADKLVHKTKSTMYP